MPPKQKQDQLSQQEAIALIAAALAINASARATAERLSPPLGIPLSLLLPVIMLATTKPFTFTIVDPVRPSRSALSEASALEPAYRAHYILQASRRMQQAVAGGMTEAEALRRERRYFDQHIEAVAARARAARSVDAASKQFGPELGWYAKLDARTSSECRAAHGKNFSVTRVPPIGYPGAVHTFCRCRPGKRHNTSETVYTVRRAA